MITKVDKLREKLEELEDNINKDDFEEDSWKFIKNCLHFFWMGLENIEEGHIEMGYIAFACIVEGLASKKYYQEFSQFKNWVRENEDEIEIPEEPTKEDYIETIEDNFDTYKKNYGARQNFVKIFLEKYRKTGTAPSFVKNKEVIEIEDGVERIQKRTRPLEDKDEAFEAVEKLLKKVYDEYRSPMLHEAETLGFEEKIMSKIGGVSSPVWMSAQDFGIITFDIFEYYADDLP